MPETLREKVMRLPNLKPEPMKEAVIALLEDFFKEDGCTASVENQNTF